MQKSALALRRFLLLALTPLILAPAFAADGGVAQALGDPVVEARVTRLAEELRCLTCMGQSIADSQSAFSSDMKREIRAMIVAGKSDKEIVDFMVQRYGDFVLYRPPVKSTTWLLWGGPFLLLALALLFLVAKLRKRSAQAGSELSESEHRQAASLLGKSVGDGK
ncbi:MAG: cytochrome c-type biogenesis protein CcmH [Rhodocyclales bacterium]|nr:cytochrome c-type biogenesis protein CcmH [Rhodocyclales bacterium]